MEGFRNSGLTRFAGSLRAAGMDREEILSELRKANKYECIPPLPDSELRNIAKSASKWPPHPAGDGHRHITIPRGCLNPTECGFDPAAVVNADTTLGLRCRHKKLFRVLVEFFGVYGCHPSQQRIAEALGTSQQQVARDIKRLVTAGLIRVDAGAYRAGDRRYAANSYHFRRHHLFAAEFKRHSSRAVNEIAAF